VDIEKRIIKLLEFQGTQLLTELSEEEDVLDRLDDVVEEVLRFYNTLEV